MSVLLLHCGCLSDHSDSADSSDSSWCSLKEDSDSRTLATNSIREEENLNPDTLNPDTLNPDTKKVLEQIAPTTWYVASITAAEETCQPTDQLQEETPLSDSRDSNEYRKIVPKVYDPISDFRDETIDDCSVASGQDSHQGLEETMKMEMMKMNLTDNHTPALCVNDERDATNDVASERVLEEAPEEALEMVLGMSSPLRPRLSSRTVTDVVQEALEIEFGKNQRGTSMASSSHLFAFHYFKKHCGANSAGARSNLRNFQVKNDSSNTVLAQLEPNNFVKSSATPRTTLEVNLRSKSEIDKARAKIMSSTALRKSKPMIGPQLPDTMSPTEFRVFCKLEGSAVEKEIIFNPDKTTFKHLMKDIAHKVLEDQSMIPGGYLFRKSKEGASVVIDDLRKLQDEDHLIFIPAGSLTSRRVSPDDNRPTTQDEVRTPAPENMAEVRGASTAEEDAIVSNAAAAASVSATAAAAAVSYLSRKKLTRNSIPTRPRRILPRAFVDEGEMSPQLESREPVSGS